MNQVMECGYCFFWIILALLVCSTAGADGSDAEDSKERSGFSAEQLVAGSLAIFPSDAFDSLKDYSGDPEARAILANCRVPASIHALSHNSARCSLANGDHSTRFLRDITKIADNTSIQLAVVDEESRDAMLYFRVLLTREGEESKVEIFGNWGHDAEKYGYAYQAPQRLMGWPKRWRKYPCGSSRIISLVTIEADSSVLDDVELEVISGDPSTECLNALEGYLLESKFIPGRNGKKLIEARHVQYWGPGRR